MSSVALGTTVFARTDDLRRLLESISGEFVDHVYVADDGDSDERSDLYARSFPFELTVFDLAYDAGVGEGRNRIARELTEEYLLLVDSDHRLPPNVEVLRTQLDAAPELGGVAGTIMEPERGRVWNPGSDFSEHTDGDETTLRRTDDVDDREIRTVAGHPLVEFDFTATMSLFRRACVKESPWDDRFVIGGSHLDFYLGHYHETAWTFATCPSVCFPHYPGGDDHYAANRWSDEKLSRDYRWLREKWGYDRIDTRKDWFDSDLEIGGRTLAERAARVYAREGPFVLLRDGVGYAADALRSRFRG